MKYNKLSRFAIPYVGWMTLFVVLPILMVVIYAFSSAAGGFTLVADDIKRQNESHRLSKAFKIALETIRFYLVVCDKHECHKSPRCCNIDVRSHRPQTYHTDKSAKHRINKQRSNIRCILHHLNAHVLFDHVVDEVHKHLRNHLTFFLRHFFQIVCEPQAQYQHRNYNKPTHHHRFGDPQTAYDHPATRFVASFIGEMNFLTKRDGSSVAVRPEDVTITRGEVQGQISGDVRTIMVLGHFVEVNVEVENRQVIKTYVARNVADQLHMKDRVSLSFAKTFQYCA